MNNIIKCPNPFKDETKEKIKVFLMGPIQGAPEWQNTLHEIDNVVYLSPRREVYPDPNFDYNKQVNWETDAINYADIILVWIPEEMEQIEGRDYAQTTRFEVGENMAKGKKIIIGINKDFSGRKYFEYKAKRYKDNVVNGKVYESLEECLNILMACIMSIKIDKTLLKINPIPVL